jgi:hypothetical protein
VDVQNIATTRRLRDRVAVRLAAFAVVLVVAFGVGAGLGAALGPDADAPAEPDHGSSGTAGHVDQMDGD